MNILGLISSPIDPASRARILQYVPYFKEQHHELSCKYYYPLRDLNPPKWSKILQKATGISAWRSSDMIKSAGRIPLLFQQRGYDIVWQNRLIQLQHSFWEKQLKKPVVFDFDDAIWLNEGEQQVAQKIATSNMIFAGNEYLADFARLYNPNVKLVPTTIDTRKLYPLGKPPKHFTIGWSGTKSNFTFLESIKEPLLKFLREIPESRLLIVSSEMPLFLPTDNHQIIFQKWRAEEENNLLNQFSVGIMPLPDSLWTRGKCGYKLLQYLACGKPVIANPTGVNSKILGSADIGMIAVEPKEWYNALLQLKNETGLSEFRGLNGRKLVEKEYSCQTWIGPIISYLKTII